MYQCHVPCTPTNVCLLHPSIKQFDPDVRFQSPIARRRHYVILHQHSVKGIEVVRCCNENENKTSSDLTLKRRNAIWSHQNKLCFVHIFLILDTLYICYQKGGFSYRACDEEMPNPLLVLTPLKIICRYQWYISLSISYLVLILLSKYK